MIALPTTKANGTDRCSDLAILGKNSWEVDSQFAIVARRPRMNWEECIAMNVGGNGFLGGRMPQH